MSAKVWKWGVAGCGLISSDFVTCLSRHPRAAVVSCASRDPEKARAFGYESLMQDREVDIIYVGTVHTSHLQLVTSALRSGKHVLCEKPLGLSAQQCGEMVQCARLNRRFLCEAVWTRFFPAVRAAVKMICEEDVIGKVVSYEGSFSAKMPGVSQVPRLWDNASGAGSTTELGVYVMHWLPLLFGADSMPSRVESVGGSTDAGRGADCAANSRWSQQSSEDGRIDTFASTVLSYADGRYAAVHTSMLATCDNTHRIVGDKGLVLLNGHAPDSLSVRLFDHDGVSRLKASAHRKKEFPLPYFDGCSLVFSRSEGLTYEIEGVTRALDKGQVECEEYPWSHSLMTHRIMDRVRGNLAVSYAACKL